MPRSISYTHKEKPPEIASSSHGWGFLLLTWGHNAWSRSRVRAKNTTVCNDPRAAAGRTTLESSAAGPATPATLFRAADVPGAETGQAVGAGVWHGVCITKRPASGTCVGCVYLSPLRLAFDETRKSPAHTTWPGTVHVGCSSKGNRGAPGSKHEYRSDRPGN